MDDLNYRKLLKESPLSQIEKFLNFNVIIFGLVLFLLAAVLALSEFVECGF